MFNIKYFLFFTFLTLSTVSAYAVDLSLQGVVMKPAAEWLQQEAQIAEMLLLKNIAPKGTMAGVVIASPQTENPNYYRHWVRDSALTMEVVFRLLKENKQVAKANDYGRLLQDYVQFSRQGQVTAGLGEPIFEVDGRVFLGPWGRPQNDGPALRAIVLTEWANFLLDHGQTDYVRNNLYAAVLPANSIIKADLEYVSTHWSDPCFDLWEEVKANHFYTKMVQRKSLFVGANLARRLGDIQAAEWYEKQAKILEQSILEHVDVKAGFVLASLNWVEGLNTKKSNIDIAVILGVLHGQYDQFFQVTETVVLQTFEKLTQVFSDLYQINKSFPQLAAAIGRYPEDIYAGTNFNGGNPWVLATLAEAEYCYKVAAEISSNEASAKSINLSTRWMKKGDEFVQRVQFHANPDGSLSEQIDRTTGYMSSARDLTWNYAAILTTVHARRESKAKIVVAQNKYNKIKKIKSTH